MMNDILLVVCWNIQDSRYEDANLGLHLDGDSRMNGGGRFFDVISYMKAKPKIVGMKVRSYMKDED